MTLILVKKKTISSEHVLTFTVERLLWANISNNNIYSNIKMTLSTVLQGILCVHVYYPIRRIDQINCQTDRLAPPPPRPPCCHHQTGTTNNQTSKTKITSNTVSRSASCASGASIMRKMGGQWCRSRKWHAGPLPWELPCQCSDLRLGGRIQRSRGQGEWSCAGVWRRGRAVVQGVPTDPSLQYHRHEDVQVQLPCVKALAGLHTQKHSIPER